MIKIRLLGRKPTHKARVRQAPGKGNPYACLTHAFATLSIMLWISPGLFGQIPVIEKPKPATLKQVEIGTNQQNQIQNPYYNLNKGISDRTRQNNQMIMQEVERHQRQNSIQRMNGLYKNLEHNFISYKLPELASFKGTEYYYDALSKLNDMLTGKSPLNLKQAVFTVENAYFESQMDYEQFEKSIKNAVDICNLKMAEYGIDNPSDLVKNFTIFNYMSDTLHLNIPGKEQQLTHYPFQYDFKDYMGNKNWSNMFVSKLMATNSGQCHSMPLFYLILAQELNAESYLTYSPNHSFIRFKSQNGGWYNAELTSGSIISDAAILESGFVKAEAIRNGIYMDTLSLHETIAAMINDLASGYIHKYGYDSFVKQCVDVVKKYYPNQLNTVMLEANWQTRTTLYIANQKGNPQPTDLIKDPIAKENYIRMHEIYAKIDSLGYEYMPEEHYDKWLKSLKKEKNKPENQKNFIHQIIE